MTVFVTSSRYRQTNSAQALKGTNRFTRLNADPCSYARVSRLDADSDFGEVCFDRVRLWLRIGGEGNQLSNLGWLRLRPRLRPRLKLTLMLPVRLRVRLRVGSLMLE